MKTYRFSGGEAALNIPEAWSSEDEEDGDVTVYYSDAPDAGVLRCRARVFHNPTQLVTQSAVDAASSLAKTFHRTLLVVHARSSAEASAFLNPEATTLEEFGIKATIDSPVRCLIKDGHPADAVPRAVDQYRPSMLVVGVKRTSQSRGPHGTVFALLAASRVPVLCVPGPAAEDAEESQVQVSVKTM